jgi:hypothetical protein
MSKKMGKGWAMFVAANFLRPSAAEIAKRLGEAWDKGKTAPNGGWPSTGPGEASRFAGSSLNHGQIIRAVSPPQRWHARDPVA